MVSPSFNMRRRDNGFQSALLTVRNLMSSPDVRGFVLVGIALLLFFNSGSSPSSVVVAAQSPLISTSSEGAKSPEVTSSAVEGTPPEEAIAVEPAHLESYIPPRTGNVTGSSQWASSLLQTPLGSMGPDGTTRRNLRYYDSLYFLALQYGANAKSLLEVGCSNDPFANYLNWIDQRVCVAPYFISYGTGKDNNTRSGTNVVQSIKADFMKWEKPHRYDLVICGQVLEHVPNPRGFLQKLIHTAEHAAVVSVPYMWKECGTNCGHVNHLIDEKKIAEWSAPHKPIYQGIIRESNGITRIITVFLKPKKK